MRSLIYFAAILAMTLGGFPAHAADKTSLPQSSVFTDAQRSEIDQMIGDYLRRNPDVVLEAIRQLQTREQAETQDKQQKNLVALKSEIEQDPTSPVIGNPEGNVTVVEFFDYRCPYCKAAFPSIQALLKDDGNIRYVLKEFPILSPESRVAARAAQAVWTMDKSRYFALHSRLIELKGDFTEARIFDAVKQAGLDPDKVRAAMAAPEIDQILAANATLAQDLGISGTPGFVFADKLIPGLIDLTAMKDLVAEARHQTKND